MDISYLSGRSCDLDLSRKRSTGLRVGQRNVECAGLFSSACGDEGHRDDQHATDGKRKPHPHAPDHELTTADHKSSVVILKFTSRTHNVRRKIPMALHKIESLAFTFEENVRMARWHRQWMNCSKSKFGKRRNCCSPDRRRSAFAKSCFSGVFFTDAIIPYPQLSSEQKAIGDKAVTEVREYLEEHLDAAEVDRNSDIPPEVIRGLADVGVLGMTIAPELGGRGLSQQNYCRVMEVIGGHCAATGVFVNAHHSIGVRGLDLFGTEEQKAPWMKPMASGEVLAAFALTEPDAGSDASNVQTRATPDPERGGYVINGEKRYITNGAIAGVLTVMARTPDPDEPDGKVTAFLVTPDMPGFEVVEAADGQMRDSRHGHSPAGLSRHVRPCRKHAGQRRQGVAVGADRFGLRPRDVRCLLYGWSQGLSEKGDRLCQPATTVREEHRGQFELVKEKIAIAAADTFAMESARLSHRSTDR